MAMRSASRSNMRRIRATTLRLSDDAESRSQHISAEKPGACTDTYRALIGLPAYSLGLRRCATFNKPQQSHPIEGLSKTSVEKQASLVFRIRFDYVASQFRR